MNDAKLQFIASPNGSQYWYEDERLVRVKDKDGSQRYYGYDPKPHMEYVKFQDGEEWFAHDGKTAKPETKYGRGKSK